MKCVMVKVTLFKRKSRAGNNANKIFLYLQFNPALFNPVTMKTIRYESLGLECYAHPKDRMQMSHNKEILKRAEAIRCRRQIGIINDEFGFVDKTLELGDFLNFLHDFCVRKEDSTKPMSTYKHFSTFVNGKCRFRDVTVDLCDRFRTYLLDMTQGPKKQICNNSASGYFSTFRSALKEAYKKRLIKENINDFLEKIPTHKVHRTYLTLKEVKQLKDTPCDVPVLKRASLFSILTGLRISDILTLDWSHITTAPDGEPCIIKRIVKSDRDEVIFISREALEFCGSRTTGLVFKGLKKSTTYNHLSKWIKDAGITKHVTFHIFRHTNATLLMASGNDIYTVSKMLTHQNVETTQIYADVVDEQKRIAANSLSLK